MYYYESFASGNLSMSLKHGVILINGTIGKCNLIIGDKCSVITTDGRMFHDKIVLIDNEKSALGFENVGLLEINRITFIGREDN